jgi:hypothetical protein
MLAAIIYMLVHLLAGGDPTLPAWAPSAAVPVARVLAVWYDYSVAVRLYLAAVVADGDYQNDWLTHLPHAIRPIWRTIGYLLALLLGT